jgi:hypothetical protein
LAFFAPFVIQTGWLIVAYRLGRFPIYNFLAVTGPIVSTIVGFMLIPREHRRLVTGLLYFPLMLILLLGSGLLLSTRFLNEGP